MRIKLSTILLATLFLWSCDSPKQQTDTFIINPIIPGYFADPSIVQHDGKFYLYATADPWGADFLSCWVSDDLQEWTFNKLNWPTKEACTSPISSDSKVWAPSVIKKGDAFYMYISVGSEVWCGKAAHPLGPWENMLGDKAMIPYDTTKYYHVIDAEAFIDDDGKSYLYWGSGWNWINGHCYAAELNEDMCTFKSEIVEVTPTHYFEGPLMVKHNSKYYLTYSEGKTMDDTYEVRYAIGDNPFGPFEEAANSPILKTDKTRDVYGPGHHTMFTLNGKDYILYHRHRLPYEEGTAFRQICINEYTFDENTGLINNIVPQKAERIPDLSNAADKKYIQPDNIASSSELTPDKRDLFAFDDDYSTLWNAAADDNTAWIEAGFDTDTFIKDMELRLEYPWKTYYLKVEYLYNDSDWKTAVDYTTEGISGSPVTVVIGEKTKKIKVTFEVKDETVPAIWEIKFQ